MTQRVLLSRLLIGLGSAAMLLGLIDPLEGSVVILLGSGMVVLGMVVNKSRPTVVRYWLAVLLLIALGVGSMFALSAIGGIGGNTGRSAWWALTILPYPLGWIMWFAGIVQQSVAYLKARHHRAAVL